MGQAVEVQSKSDEFLEASESREEVVWLSAELVLCN